MLSIRLSRVGKKHQPSYRLVVLDARKDPWGDYLENLGTYDPFSKKAQFKTERIQYWLGVGAKPSPTVWNLLVSQKIVQGAKVKVAKVAKDAKVAEVTKA